MMQNTQPTDSIDSLTHNSDSLLQDTVSAVTDTAHSVVSGDIFGPRSVLMELHQTAQAADDGLLTDNLTVKLITIGCFIAFCLIIYYFRGYFNSLIHTVTSKLYDDIHFEEQNKIFISFLNLTSVLGWFAIALCAVRFVEILPAFDLPEPPTGLIHQLIVPGIVLCELIIAGYQNFILKLTGRLTFSEALTERLLQTRKRIFSMLSLTLAPLAFMFLYSSPAAGSVFGILIIILITIITFLLLYKSYMLFVEQNVSILNWFLYLCTVEIFPISLFVLIVLKNT